MKVTNRLKGESVLERMIEIFVFGFYFPNITLTRLLLGVSLGLAFGAIWLFGYWPPLFRRYWLWLIMASSAVLSWLAVAVHPDKKLAEYAKGHGWSTVI
jgi:hypothetical protein